MLTTLSIKDFAIISELELSFSEGLCVLTGETGAGKSIIINALKLLLGDKARTDIIRAGESQAVVQASFWVGDAPVGEVLRGLGVDFEEGEIVVRRVIQQSGRGRIYINGTLQTLATLRDTMRFVMDISGQHEHVSLLDPSNHLEILDNFAGLQTERQSYAQEFRRYTQLRRERDEFSRQLADRAKRMDYLDFQIEELSKAKLKKGEFAQLEDELLRLSSFEDIEKLVRSALNILYDKQGDLLSQLTHVLQEIEKVRVPVSEFKEVISLLTEAKISIDTAVHVLRSVDTSEANPEKINRLQQRLHDLDKLKRRFSVEPDVLPEILAQYIEERDSLALSDERLKSLDGAIEAAAQQLLGMARSMSRKRHQAAQDLGVSSSASLQELAMENAEILIRLESHDDISSLKSDGIDSCEFLLKSNFGEEPKALAKIASGGELSRVMLAFKSVVVDRDNVGVYVFDEVDSGIGGITASYVAQTLKQVSKSKQVICITHLASIACHGDQHFQVSKSVVGERTLSAIVELSPEERIAEIARMLGGVSVTDKTLAHAADLLEQAKSKGESSDKLPPKPPPSVVSN